MPGTPYLTTTIIRILWLLEQDDEFIPEKNSKEFVPPSASEFNGTAAELITCVGKVFKYDTQGCLLVISTCTQPICARCAWTGLVVGGFLLAAAMAVLLANYLSGQIIDKVQLIRRRLIRFAVCRERGIMSILPLQMVVLLLKRPTGAFVHNLIENAFGEGVGAASVGVAPSILTLWPSPRALSGVCGTAQQVRRLASFLRAVGRCAAVDHSSK